MSTTAPVDVLVRAFRAHDDVAVAAFVDGCPPHPEREVAQRNLRELADPATRLLSLAALALAYARTPHADTALTIARATDRLAREAFAAAPADELLSVAAWSAEIAATSLATLGLSDELVASAVASLDWLASHGSTERNCVLQLWIAEAHFEQGRFADAECHLLAAERAPLTAVESATRDRRDMLRRSFDEVAKRLATELSAPRPASVGAAPDPDGFDALAGDMGASLAPETQLGIRSRFIRISEAFADPVHSHDPATLATLITELEQMRAVAQALDLGREVENILWCLQLCHRRRGEHDAALDALRALWARLEDDRASIADPVERAGTLAQFPHLFGSLAESLYLTGCREELFETVERAKGRLLADALERAGSDRAGEQPAAQVLALLSLALAGTGVHYLTYLVDDDCTYGVLLAANGSLYMERIALGRDVLREYAAIVNPEGWSCQQQGMLGERTSADLPERLAPLIDWLEPLLQRGLIAEHDHVCYCPDDDLHVIPLQLLTFAGQPLLACLSVSRVPSAWAVVAFLAHARSVPCAATIIEVPAADDAEAVTLEFPAAGLRLAAHVAAETLAGIDASVERVCALNLTGRIVHFTTHGAFPSEMDRAMDPSPFRSSGLLLAANGALPLRQAIAFGESTAGLLSPQRLQGLELDRSHVTTQVCVTGLAREGAGSDALGIERALLLAGADSVLTTHWDVPLGPSSEFCARFYDAWLGAELSRAQAWLQVARGMRDEGRPPEHWAAFSLAGDWR